MEKWHDETVVCGVGRAAGAGTCRCRRQAARGWQVHGQAIGQRDAARGGNAAGQSGSASPERPQPCNIPPPTRPPPPKPPPTPAPAPPAAPAPATKPGGAMLGGLAAGLGLAWLAHSLGLGAGFGQFLMIALLAMLAYAVYRMVLRAPQGGAGGSGLALQGAGASSPQAAQAPVQYSPHNVGNDASARPWEGSGMGGRRGGW